MKEFVLLTGGAGYIGSHLAHRLTDCGYSVIVLDNLTTGYRKAVPNGAVFIEGDAGCRETVLNLIKKYPIDGVIHMAGSTSVEESACDPEKYYKNNFDVSLNLLSVLQDAEVNNFIFSSSAAVYGNPGGLPLTEDSETAPVSPYGRSKLMVEWLLKDLAAVSGLRYVALRYFNVAGAKLDGNLGQISSKATHLIKLASEAACGKRDCIEILGVDYPTRDGSGVREYIHVEDLVQAHIDALKYLRRGGASQILNCGYGRGFSVREVLDTMRRVSGSEFQIKEGPRRQGDPAASFADPKRIKEILGWTPKYEDLDLICSTSFNWERKLN